MFCCYFTDKPVHNVADAMHSDRARFAKYFHVMLNEGIISRTIAIRGGIYFDGAHNGGH